jgi:fatty acid desaturase
MNQPRRDYGLLGDDGKRAGERGLANATWYRSAIDRTRMKRLMQRSDRRAVIDTVIWLGLIIGLGVAGVVTWLSWWSLPIFFAYGVLWGSAGDSRCHESGHGTAFKTRWMNAAMFQISCFMTMREPIVRRWDHTRHHTDTIIVGRDREIIEERPPRLGRLALLFFGIPQVVDQLGGMFRHVIGRVAPDEKLIIPEAEWPKLKWGARWHVGVLLGVVITSIATRSLLPLMLVGLPTMYGAWFMVMVGLTQHVGLAEDVLDFRLNTRTVYMNPVFRFVYWNMNYHLEHHMFPMVPFHALAELHESLKADCPPPYPSTLAVYREIVPTLRHQLSEPGYFVRRPLPSPTPFEPTHQKES